MLVLDNLCAPAHRCYQCRAGSQRRSPLPRPSQELIAALQNTLAQLKTCRGANCRVRGINVLGTKVWQAVRISWR